MFKQTGHGMACLFFVLIVLVCANSTPVERKSRGAGAGNCNGGRGIYQTNCYGEQTGNARREASVQKCFDLLYNDIHLIWGCRTRYAGRCKCTVDSSFIFSWAQTFREARQKLYDQCHGFTNSIMERYEGSMYLTATCH